MKFSPACVSALLAPFLVTAKVSVANRLEVGSEPTRIHNVDGDVENSNNKKDEEVTTVHPTIESAGSSSGGDGDKEGCFPSVTVGKTSKIDAGNLPLSSCSSSKKQICINNDMKQSSSSLEKESGVCTDVNDVPTAYWESSDIPVSYWEDTVSTTISTGHTSTRPVPGEVLIRTSIYGNNSESQLSNDSYSHNDSTTAGKLSDGNPYQQEGKHHQQDDYSIHQYVVGIPLIDEKGDVEEQLDDYQQSHYYQQQQLQELEERHLEESDCTCSDGRPIINKSGTDFAALILSLIHISEPTRPC